MNQSLLTMSILIVFLPLIGALFAGLLGRNGKFSHLIPISCVGAAFILSLCLANQILFQNHPAVDAQLYTWATAGSMHFEIGFLIDRLSVLMLLIVLFVSLMVHIYTVGYMADDPSYSRFFSYVSLFTFAMLVLVLANNFLLLFFGWEAVGLVSYLLIGFWFKKPAANAGSLKAFLVNRIGDIGFILAIAAVFMFFGTLHYSEVFNNVPAILSRNIILYGHTQVSFITLICVLLFIGAMGKSAQVPLHVWLPESMEGPTPISALIHAATMVTAGIYMVARMSPLFEYSQFTLTIILIIGGTTALLMGLVALVQTDIKRVIAYSTISQLGYMAVALGASAYDAAIFHLVTHAFFKALLFLAAGSVIIALHHEQDMRKMGGLANYLPVTYLTFLVGALALSAIPPFAGFFSKDIIIEAVQISQTPGATFAYYCVLVGAFITPVYTFRALFMTFHTKERTAPEIRGHIQESPKVVLMPLILLAIPSLIAGQFLITPMLFAPSTLLGNTIFVLPQHAVMQTLAQHYHGATQMALRAGGTLTFWVSLAGIVVAWIFTVQWPSATRVVVQRFNWFYQLLLNKFGFDAFNQKVFVEGTRKLGHFFYDVSDVKLIDGIGVNGSGRIIQTAAQLIRRLQTGYLYHYALAMFLGIIVCLAYYILGGV